MRHIWQRRVDRWARRYDVPYWTPHEIFTRLTEEVGEVAREINHQFGPKKRKKTEKPGNLTEEIGDCLFTLVCLANSRKLSINKAFAHAMKKCYGRDKMRFSRKYGKLPQKKTTK